MAEQEPNEGRPKVYKMRDAVTYFFSGKGDTTIRPRRASLPYTAPRDAPAQPSQEPPAPAADAPGDAPTAS